MRVVMCDGCVNPIDRGAAWFGVDEFIPADNEDEDDDLDGPEEDGDYSLHFHGPGPECLWAWVAARLLETTE
jgi:hypothetical protein